MRTDDKTSYHKALERVLFLFLVIEPFVTAYHRYAIFFRPISPSTEISELQALISIIAAIRIFLL